MSFCAITTPNSGLEKILFFAVSFSLFRILLPITLLKFCCVHGHQEITEPLRSYKVFAPVRATGSRWSAGGGCTSALRWRWNWPLERVRPHWGARNWPPEPARLRWDGPRRLGMAPASKRPSQPARPHWGARGSCASSLNFARALGPVRLRCHEELSEKTIR